MSIYDKIELKNVGVYVTTTTVRGTHGLGGVPARVGVRERYVYEREHEQTLEEFAMLRSMTPDEADALARAIMTKAEEVRKHNARMSEEEG